MPVKKMRETTMHARTRVVIPEHYHVCIALMKNEVHVCYARQKVSYRDKYSQIVPNEALARFMDSNTDTNSFGPVHSINKQRLDGGQGNHAALYNLISNCGIPRYHTGTAPTPSLIASTCRMKAWKSIRYTYFEWCDDYRSVSSRR